MKALLFHREHCPNCPPVVAHVSEHYPDAELIDCGTEEGMEMARERWVLSTPTLVMCNDEGEELWRAGTVKEIRSRENTEE